MDIQRIDLKQKARRKRIALIVGGVLGLVALVGFVSRLDPAAPSVPRSSLWLDTVKQGDMLREVRGPGVLVPREIRWIATEHDRHRARDRAAALPALRLADKPRSAIRQAEGDRDAGARGAHSEAVGLRVVGPPDSTG